MRNAECERDTAIKDGKKVTIVGCNLEVKSGASDALANAETDSYTPEALPGVLTQKNNIISKDEVNQHTTWFGMNPIYRRFEGRYVF